MPRFLKQNTTNFVNLLLTQWYLPSIVLIQMTDGPLKENNPIMNMAVKSLQRMTIFLLNAMQFLWATLENFGV